MTQHFLTLLDIEPAVLDRLTQRAIELKAMQKAGELFEPLKGKVLAMIFDKSSTRTRVSFEAGMAQFGGHGIFLSPRDTQFGRGEPIEDSARVLSSMADGIMIRTFEHKNVVKFAEHSKVPIINALTDLYHPCQLLADVQAFVEHRGSIKNKTVTWIGDGNNMCHSYINAAIQYDFKLRIATPEGYEANADILAVAGDRIYSCNDPMDAATGSDLIATDVWASMGQEEEQKLREAKFSSFQVNQTIMAQANPDALFTHCLPAHRGEEVAADIIDGKQSIVWDAAENRLHAQKALLEYLLG